MKYSKNKKPIKMFYSWQSDLPNKTNRGFIEDALKRASKMISKEIDIEIAVDRDTKDVAGAPEIHHTIFDKIKEADIFVADVSLINSPNKLSFLCNKLNKKKIRKTPNPNVLLELGYAISELGENRIILIHNSYTGNIEELPFDINKKRVVPYDLAPRNKNKSDERKQLVSMLKASVGNILEYAEENPKQGVPNIDFGFADYKNRERLNLPLAFKNTFFTTNEPIPDYIEEKRSGNIYDPNANFYKTNINYYREYFSAFKRKAYNEISFFIDNKGTQPLSEVKIQVTIPNINKNINIHDEDLDFPEKKICIMNQHNLKANGILSRLAESRYEIRKTANDIIIDFYLKNLQPSMPHFFENSFFVGSKLTQDVEIEVIARANELSIPWQKTLTMTFDTNVKNIITKEFIKKVDSL